MTRTSRTLLIVGSGWFLYNLYAVFLLIWRAHRNIPAQRFCVFGLIAVGLVCLFMYTSLRLAERLPSERVEKSQQAVFTLTFMGLVLISLALMLPQLLPL
jgi:hypothetical protein